MNIIYRLLETIEKIKELAKFKDNIPDMEFIRLGYTLYSNLDNKLVYRKILHNPKCISMFQYIEIRINIFNEIHIISHDENMKAMPLSIEEIEVCMNKIHELMERKKDLIIL